jgi:hypothetical protein
MKSKNIGTKKNTKQIQKTFITKFNFFSGEFFGHFAIKKMVVQILQQQKKKSYKVIIFYGKKIEVAIFR